MVKTNGLNCMVTMQSWMFLSSFEKMRCHILKTKDIVCLMHMENMVLGIAFGTAVTIFKNAHTHGYKGTYNQIKLCDIENEVPKTFPVSENRFSQVSTDNFSKIPGAPVAYWVSERVINVFSNSIKAGNLAEFKHGMSTGKNEAVLRLWHEVTMKKICFEASSHQDLYNTGKRFVPYNKGGEFRKWYGNQDYILGYDKVYDALMDTFDGHRHDNRATYFMENISWSKVTSGGLAMRYFPIGFVYDVAGCSAFVKKEYTFYLLAFFNIKIKDILVSAMSPTINYEVGQLKNSPIVISVEKLPFINRIVKNNIEISNSDWDSFETSWNFKKHPMI